MTEGYPLEVALTLNLGGYKGAASFDLVYVFPSNV